MSKLLWLANIACMYIPYSLVVSDVTGFNIISVPENVIEQKFGLKIDKRIAKYKKEEFLR